MKIVALVSGGLDSAVLLYTLLQERHTVLALSVDYGQRHAKELEYAAELARALGVRHAVADLRGLRPLLAGSSLTSPEVGVPDGHYAEETMKLTVVPNRNMIMLSVAVGWAITERCEAVAYAAHAGDHAVYPDCRAEFAEAMDRAVQLADWHPVRLLRPFVGLTKAELVRKGTALGVPFDKTWSCYRGGALHCGTCGTCVERREAFIVAGVKDPTAYAATAPLPPRPAS